MVCGALYAAPHHSHYHRPFDAYPTPVSGTVDIPSLAVISHLGHVSCCRGDERYTASVAEHTHSLLEILGYVSGCAFTILWGKETPQWGPLPRLGFKYTRLLTVGFACLLAYQVLMYFCVSPVLNLERLWLPTFLRAFGYSIFFATMTLYLKDLIEFPFFFHALTISGFIRNGVAESMCSGMYSYGLRHQIAETLNRGLHTDYQSILMVAVKEMFGIMCIIGTIVLLLMLLYDVQPVRSTMRKMPKLKNLGNIIVKQLHGKQDPNILNIDNQQLIR